MGDWVGYEDRGKVGGIEILLVLRFDQPRDAREEGEMLIELDRGFGIDTVDFCGSGVFVALAAARAVRVIMEDLDILVNIMEGREIQRHARKRTALIANFE